MMKYGSCCAALLLATALAGCQGENADPSGPLYASDTLGTVTQAATGDPVIHEAGWSVAYRVPLNKAFAASIEERAF